MFYKIFYWTTLLAECRHGCWKSDKILSLVWRHSRIIIGTEVEAKLAPSCRHQHQQDHHLPNDGIKSSKISRWKYPLEKQYIF